MSCGSPCIRIVGRLIGGLDRGKGLAGIQSQAVHWECKQLSICGFVTLFLHPSCRGSDYHRDYAWEPQFVNAPKEVHSQEQQLCGAH